MNMKPIAGIALFMLGCCLTMPCGALVVGNTAGVPVAAGYPNWQGVEPGNYVCGLQVCPSDLRHRATVVVEFEAENADTQLPMVAQLVRWSVPYGEETWEFYDMSHNYMVLFSNRGKRDKAAMAKLKAFLDGKDNWMYKCQDAAPIYHDVRFPGGPDAKGKYPMVYAMPFEGTEPLVSAYADKDGLNKAMSAARGVCAQRQKFGWKDFTGVAEPKFVKGVAQAVAARKPLDPSIAAARALISSPDPEQAKEGQIVYDALNQARTDLLMRIRAEGKFSPVRGYYDVARLTDYFPQMKKSRKALVSDFRPNVEAPALALMLDDVIRLRAPDFEPKGPVDAKKIVVRLKNHKKALAKLKDHKDVTMQSSVSVLDGAIDELMDRFASTAK